MWFGFSKSSKFDVIESVSQSASLSPAKLEFRLTPAIQKAIIESGKKFDSYVYFQICFGCFSAT